MVCMTCGIDEAGRGPVIGPLVIAGVSTSERNIKKFIDWGVKDSKKLSREKREELFKLITKNCRWHAVKVFPAELDNLMTKGKNLNEIEAIKFGEVINTLEPTLAVIDSADVNPQNFRRAIERVLQCDSELLVEHHADENHAVVSAASIIAKVERDREIDKLKERYEVGSGYPSDPVTIKFLEDWYKGNKSFPDFVRKKWKTLDLIANAKISDFL